MVLSLFCTGFATWTVTTPPQGENWNYDGGSFVSHGVTHVPFTPEYFGISLTDKVNGVVECDTFRYSTITQTGSGSVDVFTNTTLSVLIQIDPDVMAKRMAESDYRNTAVLINCYRTALNATPPQRPFGKGKNNTASLKSQKLEYSENCKLILRGYPNLYITAPVAVRQSDDTKLDGSLDVTIPIEQLYNLAVLDKISLNTTPKATIYIELELEFVDTGYAGNISGLCGDNQYFTIQTQDKP